MYSDTHVCIKAWPDFLRRRPCPRNHAPYPTNCWHWWLPASGCWGDETRLKLVQALRDRELNVEALAEAAGTSQANASKHLAALLEAGIVDWRRAGGNVFYRVSGRVVYFLIDAVCSGLDAQTARRRDLLATLRPEAP